MSKNHLGIDHPLVAVSDMEKAASDFEKLGFFINPRHHHPWGTDNHLLMFPENFIELISVYDHSKLDLKNDAGFAFGRFIQDSIERREGISLVALHSEDARTDFAHLQQEQVENQGLVDFRRVAHRPDGSEEEAVVSLVMLVNSDYPAVSNFLCHQHKPHLVWVEDWMHHPNAVNAITGVSYVVQDPLVFLPRYRGIYGESAITSNQDILTVQTDRGTFEFMTSEYAAQRFSGVELPLNHDQLPCGVAITLSSSSIDQSRNLLNKNDIDFVETDKQAIRIPAHYAGNTIFEIHPA